MGVPPGPSAHPPRPNGGPRHLPGLDAVRALAVTAAIAYHLDLLRGGFLGVEVFFVLSGYLVTALALLEVERTGRLGLGAFWARRARRLLPALLVLVPVVGVGAIATGWAPTRLRSLAADGLATLTWTANWRQAVSETTYWSAGTPSPFRHTWSLSIEEQFYAAWPLVLTAAIAVARRRGWSLRRTVAVAAATGAAASTAASVGVARGGGDLSVLYLGTHARVAAPLIGCVLACAWSGDGRLDRDLSGRGRRAVAVGGLAGLVTLGWLTVTAGVDDPDLYRRGGFLVASLAAAATIAAATATGSFGPVVSWVGRRSYGLYLWSWPTQVLVQASHPELSRTALVLVTVAGTAVAAELSWQLVERRALGRPKAGQGRRVRPPVRRTPAGIGWVVGAVASVAVLGVVAARSEPPPLQERVTAEESAELATRAPTAPGGPGTTVMVTGDSIGFTAALNLPDDDVLASIGLGRVEGRAILGCGVLAGDGYEYPDADRGDFQPAADGICERDQRAGEANGLLAEPDVVLSMPGAWEATDVRSPTGRVVPARSDEMADLLVAEILERARTADEAGARTVLLQWSCPGRNSAPERRDPDFTRWFNRDVLDRAAEEGGAEGLDLGILEPTAAVCEDGDPLGRPTAAKDEALADELHVTDRKGGAWAWTTWLGPPLVRD